MFGHPWHPIAVHLPITLLVGGVLIDLVSALPSHRHWRKAGFFHLVLGTVGAVLALATGAVDMAKAEGSSLLLNHALFGGLASLVFGVMMIGRVLFRNRQVKAGAPGDPEAEVPGRLAAVYFTLALVGVGLMVATGFTGGELVYGQGVGTALVR